MNYNTPKEVAQNYIATGVAKTKLPASKMLLLGILAGMFIALAGVGATVASATVASPSLAKLVGAFIFPVGLAMVLLAGSELFTGSSLIIIPVLEKEAKISGMLKNWVLVYIGNFIGSVIIALLVVYGGTGSMFGNEVAAAMINTAAAKTSLDFMQAVYRGILCNFLVCIAVWISFAAKDIVGKITGLFMPIMLFVLCGYEHSVANMYYITAGLFAAKNPVYMAAASNNNISTLSWGSLFTKNLIPVTIGNIIGGAILVGLVYWFIYLRDPAEKKTAAKKK